MRKRQWLLPLGILAAGALVAGGIYLLKEEPQGQQREQPPPFVASEPVNIHNGPIPVIGSGLVRATALVRLAPQVAGRIVAVSENLESGNRVEAGEMLVTIEQQPFEIDLRQARAELAATEADLAFTRRQLERLDELTAQGYTEEQRYDELLAQRDRLAAQVQRLQAAVEQAQLNLSYTTVAAPFDARVLGEDASPGDYVTVGQELARIYYDGAVEIPVSLDAAEAALLPGLWQLEEDEDEQRLLAEVSTEVGEQRYRWDGFVDRAEADIDPQSRTVRVVVVVPEPFRGGEFMGDADTLTEPPPLLPNTYVTATIAGRELARYISVPRSALRARTEILVVKPDNTLRIVQIDPITQVRDRVLLRAEGIDAEDRVVTMDIPEATDGMAVRLQREREAPGAEVAQSESSPDP